MTRTITVKGTGSVNAVPDYVIISMNLESRDLNYEDAMNAAARNIGELNNSLEGAGFDRKEVKTTNFNVHTDYEFKKKKTGDYERIFRGYVINQDVTIGFDMDPKRLAKALSVVSSCLAHPQLAVSFTVKDGAAVSDELLRSAAQNAKRKAEILCSAAGAQLGNLQAIDYSWGELNLYSNTRYDVQEECMPAPMMAKGAEIAIEPEDIKLRDTATFIWEIL